MTTKHMNLQTIATGAVEWPAIVNDLINKVEAGTTIKAIAGEVLIKGNPFRIASDSKAWKATNSTECMGVWQSVSTAVGLEGFGQIDRMLTFGTWATGDKIYVSSAGALTTVSTGNGTPIAIAISTTEIFVITQLRLTFGNVADLLAVASADISVNSKKLTSVATPTAGTDATNKTYVDGLVVGLIDDRGNYDASGNVYPSTGGSGTGGAILKGDLWYISVAGVLGGVAVNIGDSVRALVDTPAQTGSNWNVLESNIGYVPENVVNKENTTLDTSTTKYPTNRLTKEYADTKALLAGSATQVFSVSGLKVSEATNGKQGVATLVAGVAVVSNTSITANSRIFLTSQVDGGTVGFLRVSDRTVGVSFTITSSNVLDISTVAYQIFEPA